MKMPMEWKWGLALGGFHALLALIFCFGVYPRLAEATSGLDPDGYGQLGRALYETGRFDSLDKPPLYPAFVALVSMLAGGYRTAAVQAAQSFLSAAAVTLLYAVFRRTLHQREMAFAAGLAAAVYPLTLWYIPRLWTETFLTIWIAAYTLALCCLLKTPRRLNAVLCGLAAGFAALTKGITLIFLPLTVLILILFMRRGGWRLAAWVSLAALVVLIPWTWRNWQASGALLPVHAEAGYNFYLGNGFTGHWLEAPLSYVQLKERTEAETGFSAPADPLERDRRLLDIALRQIAANPALILRKLLVGGLTFWYLAADAPKSLLTAALQGPIVLTAGWGVFKWLRRRAEKPTAADAWLPVLLIPVLGIWAASAAVFAFGRLSAPVMPYVIGLAIFGVWGLPDKIWAHFVGRAKGL